MAGGKWIEGLTPATETADAARRVLSVRLGVVRESLPLAAKEFARDPEHVHQLRVGTRRARAALDIFACCLPQKAYRAAKKQLRAIRRAAGQARDWDVFLAGLGQREDQKSRRHQAGLDFLMGYAIAQRAIGQEHLVQAAGNDPPALKRFATDLVAAVEVPADEELRTLGKLAWQQTSCLARALEKAAALDLDDYQHLHQVRILGKRLRYAMEVFADCFAAPFRAVLYPAVEEMQEILGRANDSHVAAGRLEALREQLRARLPDEWPRLRPALDDLRRFHRKRLPRERDHFRAWQQQWRPELLKYARIARQSHHGK